MTTVSRGRLVPVLQNQLKKSRRVEFYNWPHQVVIVPFHLAHPKLLLPGFASYYTEENVEKYANCIECVFCLMKKCICRHKDIILPEDSIINSSASAKDFIAFFSKRVFDVCLSSSTPWTIEKWHIKASLRQVQKILTNILTSIPKSGNTEYGSVRSR